MATGSSSSFTITTILNCTTWPRIPANEPTAKRNPRKAAELRAKLSAWQKRIKAKMPVLNPDYKAEGKSEAYHRLPRYRAHGGADVPQPARSWITTNGLESEHGENQAIGQARSQGARFSARRSGRCRCGDHHALGWPGRGGVDVRTRRGGQNLKRSLPNRHGIDRRG